jgi:hypothetical protein
MNDRARFSEYFDSSDNDRLERCKHEEEFAL